MRRRLAAVDKRIKRKRSSRHMCSRQHVQEQMGFALISVLCVSNNETAIGAYVAFKLQEKSVYSDQQGLHHGIPGASSFEHPTSHPMVARVDAHRSPRYIFPLTTIYNINILLNMILILNLACTIPILERGTLVGNPVRMRKDRT